eukprot:347482-Rhodomonas_salina.1
MIRVNLGSNETAGRRRQADTRGLEKEREEGEVREREGGRAQGSKGSGHEGLRSENSRGGRRGHLGGGTLASEPLHSTLIGVSPLRLEGLTRPPFGW